MQENVKKPEDVTQAKPSIKKEFPTAADESSFKSYMQGEEATPAAAKTPMELEKTPPFQVGNPTYDSVNGQFNDAQTLLNNIQNQLNVQGLKFKRSEQSLLESKLSDANSQIRTASEKLGLKPGELSLPSKTSPLTRFIGFVTDGQRQLIETQKQLQELSQTGMLKPEDLLIVQIKLSQAQQELEYSSIVLSKVVDFIRQTMNIQI